MKLKITTDSILVATIVLLLLSVATLVAISISESKQVDNTAKMVAHTNEVIMHAESLLSSVKDNESGSRGYVLTGQGAFLEQVERSKKRTLEELQVLRELTAGNPAQQKMVDSLSVHINSRVAFSDNNIRTYDQQGAATAMEIVRSGRGRIISEQARRVIDTILSAENELLLQRKEENEHKARNLTGILSTGVIGILLLLGIFIQKIRTDYSEKRKAAAKLARLNEELEERVQQRTNELAMSQKVLSQTFERITDAFLALDRNWCFTYVNKAACDLTRRNPESLIGKNIWEEFPEAVGSDTYRVFHKAMQEQRYMYNEDYFEPLLLWHENYIYPSPEGISVFIKDISERKKADEKIEKANRLYFFISQVNQMIVRTTDEETLFKEACRIAVELGKFSMAWIGMVDEASQTVIPVVHAGEDQQYFSEIKPISIKAVPEGMGPTGSAIREGKYHICNDIESDPQMIPWKEAALDRGYRSSMALPIIKFGKVVGAFSFYAPVKDFFDETEIALLEEATGDVSFALEVLEKEDMRKKAEQAVLESERRYHTLAEVSPVGIFHTDAAGLTTYVNPRWCRISGLSYEEAMGNGWFKAVHEEDKMRLKEGWEKATQQKDVSFSEYRFVRTDGTNAWVIGQAIPERDADDRVVGYVGTITDITERKKAEEAIQQTSGQLRLLTAHLLNIREEERRRIGREIHDELGQQLTAIKMDVAWIDKKITPENEAIKTKLKNVIALLNGGNQSIRRILNELRPVILDEYGLHEALKWQAEQFTKNTGIPVEFKAGETQIKVMEDIATCVFRVYQEALTNITRYARAGKVLTSLNIENNNVILSVEDDGAGFDTESVKNRKSFGILGMKERVHSLDGSLELFSTPGKGTKLKISLPLTR